MKHIRNFSIIAHIDHGKSTLSDRLIQTCGGLSDREMQAQVLDSMDLERERGITIKAQSVTLNYQAQDGNTYQLNFIDTPGHVEFSYEVSRSLAACEGALLVVDAGQGVEAQTLANCYTAMEMELEVVPILYKIDLPAAEPERVAEEIEDIVGIDAIDAVRCSAKTGLGVDLVLEEIVARIPSPEGDPDAPLQALIIDSWFDSYLGVVSLVREGRLRELSIGAAARVPGFPDLPTTAEAGVPFMAVDAWFGLFAPRGVDAARVTRLSEAFLGALAQPETAERATQAGLNAAPMGPAAFTDFQQAEVRRWQEMATLTGIMME